MVDSSRGAASRKTLHTPSSSSLHHQPHGTPKISSMMFIQKGTGTLYDHYSVGKSLGRGAFGEVFLCTHYNSKEQRAVKWIKKEFLDSDAQARLINEINILKTLDHPNVVKIYEYFDDCQCYYIVMEYIKGGALLKEISKRGKFEERDAAVLVNQLLSCCSYLHQHKIVHRDLKPDNVMLEDRQDFDQIKLIDFGTAHEVIKGRVMRKVYGTKAYIAPEVLLKEYGSKCDVWSIGVMTYIFLCGE